MLIYLIESCQNYKISDLPNLLKNLKISEHSFLSSIYINTNLDNSSMNMIKSNINQIEQYKKNRLLRASALLKIKELESDSKRLTLESFSKKATKVSKDMNCRLCKQPLVVKTFRNIIKKEQGIVASIGKGPCHKTCYQKYKLRDFDRRSRWTRFMRGDLSRSQNRRRKPKERVDRVDSPVPLTNK